MTFSITLGDLLTIATVIVSVMFAYVRMAERMTHIETRVTPMWDLFVAARQRDRRARTGDKYP